MSPDYWSEACETLSQTDSVLSFLIKKYPQSILKTRGCALTTLLRAIVGQQISVMAADAVWGRLSALCDHKIEPSILAAISDEQYRAVGLSRQKIRYIREIVQFFQANGPVDFLKQDPDTTRKQLLAITGVGPWTVNMFLIFHAMAPDILPLGDLGLIKAMRQFYPELTAADKPTLEAFAQRWRPYRTVATWYLWRALDPVEVAY